MLLGFLILSYDDLRDLQTRLGRDMEKSYPLITIQDDMAKSSMDSKRKARAHTATATADKESGRPSQPRKSQENTIHDHGDHQESIMANKSHRPVESPHRDGSADHVPSQQGRGDPGAKSEQQQQHQDVPPPPPPPPGPAFEIDDAFSIKSFDSEDDEDDDFGGSDEL